MLGEYAKNVKLKVGGDFTPVPMDKYTLQITDVDLVKQFNQWKGAEVDMLKYQFTILDEKPMPDGETTRGRLLWSRVSLSVGSRSTFGKLLVAAFGRELTKEELENLNPEALVGLQVDAMVDAKPDKEGTTIYNNILSFSKTLKPLATVEAKPNAGQAVVQKTTVPAVAPDAENPDAFISQMEQEAKAATVTPAQPQAVAAAPVAAAVDASAEAEALAAEAEAAELAAQAAAAKAKAAAAKAAVAQQGKAV